MRLIKYALLTTVMLPSLAWGDWIRGTAFQNGQPLAGKDITIHCPRDVTASGPTDEWEAFREVSSPRLSPAIGATQTGGFTGSPLL